jgi:cytochrome c55X
LSNRTIQLLAALLGALAAAPVAAEAPNAARQAELVRLVRQDCGSCHGLLLSGGLGPALLPQTLAGKPADSMVATILAGRPGTPMPPWQTMLSEQEATWIVERLQSGFPQE